MRIEEELKLDFQDVLIRPKRSTLTSRSEVDISREFAFRHSGRRYHGVPIIAANMDTVGTFEMAQALDRHQLATALHKHYDEGQLAAFFTALPETSTVFYSMGITREDYEKFCRVKNAVGEAIGYVCVDVANGYTKAFVDFLHRLPFYGVAVVCGDDPNVQEIIPRVAKQIVTYGIDSEANFRAEDLVAEGGTMRFTCVRTNGNVTRLPIVLNLPGRHNVLNALAAIAVATEVGVGDTAIIKALADFKGVGRRFQRYGEIACAGGGHFTLVDDYGHHPAEMAATLAAARGAFPGRRLVLAFQPHRYTRTRDCFEDFVKVLGGFDALLLGEVYAAGEAPIIAADARSLVRALRVAGKIEPVFVEDIAAMPAAILAAAKDGDVVITMGAGSIGGVPGKLADG